MRVEDLAEALGDQYGITQAEMEGYLLEQVDTITAGDMQVSELFVLDRVAETDLSRAGEQRLREQIAEQFRDES